MINNKKITLEDLLCFFIIFCPILDVASFLFRNYFNTSISISTVLRPIIPIASMIYIFFKDGKKRKMQLTIFISALIFMLYACIHLYIFRFLQTESSYGNWLRELQYLVNYTFMIMNLFIYIYVFVYRNGKNDEAIRKIKKAILISFTLYIGLMYLAILTQTSSYTYTEDQMGYKGWFESGNSVGAIMIFMIFILLPELFKNNDKGIKIWIVSDVVLSGIYLTTLLGTRVGLLGFGLVIGLFIICKLVHNLLHNKKINKKIIGIGALVFIALIIMVIGFGSTTFLRRKLLKQRESEIYDYSINEPAHVTGDLLELVSKIKANQVPEEYLSKPSQDAVIDLYNYNNEHKIPYTNMRLTQLVYHTAVMREYSDFSILLFGTGFMTHLNELIFEMEVPAFLLNFGLYGFVLYCLPFLVISLYSLYFILRKIKYAEVESLMYMLALNFAIAISFLAGYTFFNQSAATLIIVMSVLNIKEIKRLKGENIEKDNNRNN